ncbi:MAG: hypothetical protein ACLRMJ_01930 [Alistipes finegoldii]
MNLQNCTLSGYAHGQESIGRSPTKYKIFWLDEAWKLLDDPYFGDFIKYLYKTIRKEDSGIGLIVQDVPDIIHSEHHEAIINNSDTMFFLSARRQGV